MNVPDENVEIMLFSLAHITWAPVTTTGFPRFSNMKESADAVKAIVSVPWRITKPSYFS